MASSSISRILSFHPNPKIPSVDNKITRKPFKFSLQWQQKKPSARASIHGGDANKALELKRAVVGSASETDSKDSQTLPRPLTNADLSNSGSGSRLRVAYQAVERWLVDRAVLPIENSLCGSIHHNYDLLLRHKLHIVGEVKYAVRHCLLANHGVKLEDLKRVLSHQQALSQCEHTLTKLGVVREAVDDTAGAAQDDIDNVTRFLMLAREPIIPGIDKPFKSSIVFSLEWGPGALFKALAVFATREINLTKIESRPQRKKPLRITQEGINGPLQYFDYLFYVDFEASMASQNAQNALRHLKEFTTFLRVLGSYPVDLNQT